jgi:hypothetical protein
VLRERRPAADPGRDRNDGDDGAGGAAGHEGVAAGR